MLLSLIVWMLMLLAVAVSTASLHQSNGTSNPKTTISAILVCTLACLLAGARAASSIGLADFIIIYGPIQKMFIT